MPKDTEGEFLILEAIHDSERALRQRELARIVGLSLGMTNALLKRLARKGWLSIRRINNRNIRYLATGAGLEKIAQRSYRYLRRTVGNIVRYREAIGMLVEHEHARGARGILLVGTSDLAFIVEHCCEKQGIAFRETARLKEGDPPRGWLVLYSEGRKVPNRGTREGEAMVVYLREVLGRAAAEPGRHGGS